LLKCDEWTIRAKVKFRDLKTAEDAGQAAEQVLKADVRLSEVEVIEAQPNLDKGTEFLTQAM